MCGHLLFYAIFHLITNILTPSHSFTTSINNGGIPADIFIEIENDGQKNVIVMSKDAENIYKIVRKDGQPDNTEIEVDAVKDSSDYEDASSDEQPIQPKNEDYEEKNKKPNILFNDESVTSNNEDNGDKPVKPIKYNKQKATLMDYLTGKLNYARSFKGRFISDTDLLYKSNGQYLALNITTKKNWIILTKGLDIDTLPKQILMSSDKKYLLLKIENKNIWRRSSLGVYQLVKKNGDSYDYQNRQNFPKNEKKKENVRYVSWSPIENALVYVDQNNDLHYCASAEENSVRLTFNGDFDNIYNGVPDWVYEEEVFEDNKALWWSPGGKRLIYAVFNDEKVDNIFMPRFGPWHGEKYSQYPVMDKVKYPKVGRVNPTVELWYVNLRKGKKMKRKKLPAPAEFEEAILTKVLWVNEFTVAVVWMNRMQNKSIHLHCHLAKAVACKPVFSEVEKNGWIDIEKSIIYNKYKSSKAFLTILPTQKGARYRQLYRVENKKAVRLTGGEGEDESRAEVTRIVEWTKDDTVYYIATDKPGERFLYKINIGKKQRNKTTDAVCLSCRDKIGALLQRKSCQYADAEMSPQGTYYVYLCHGPDIPYVAVFNTREDNVELLWGDGNKNLKDSVAKFDTGITKYMSIELDGLEGKAQVEIIFPPELFRENLPGKVPMLVYSYGGPGNQEVSKQWAKEALLNGYMAGSRQVVVATIDVRGSGYQGEVFRQTLYRSFGTVEVDDVEKVTQILLDKFDKFVDRDRVGIWGWSYGAFVSFSLLTRFDVFKCGVSVAPVTKWDLYDSIYAERCMSTLEDNPDGYNRSNPLWKVEGIRGKDFLLMHGIHDDNVHFQHSMMLSESLQERNIPFREMFYADNAHALSGYYPHVYTTITDFLDGCFKKQENYENENSYF